MRNFLLVLCVTGLAYVIAEDLDGKTSEEKVAEAKKCFKDKGIDLDAEIDRARNCSKHLPDKKDWNLDFCNSIRNNKLPCMDEINEDHLKECLKADSVDLLMKSLKTMFERICKVAENAPPS